MKTFIFTNGTITLQYSGRYEIQAESEEEAREEAVQLIEEFGSIEDYDFVFDEVGDVVEAA